MWLLIDDLRSLPVDVIARTYDAGKKLIEMGGWKGMLFDHDLGDKDEMKNGYRLLEYAIENSLLPNEVQVVTDNASGLLRMRMALTAIGFVEVKPRIFKRR